MLADNGIQTGGEAFVYIDFGRILHKSLHSICRQIRPLKLPLQSSVVNAVRSENMDHHLTGTDYYHLVATHSINVPLMDGDDGPY